MEEVGAGCGGRRGGDRAGILGRWGGGKGTEREEGREQGGTYLPKSTPHLRSALSGAYTPRIMNTVCIPVCMPQLKTRNALVPSGRTIFPFRDVICPNLLSARVHVPIKHSIYGGWEGRGKEEDVRTPSSCLPRKITYTSSVRLRLRSAAAAASQNVPCIRGRCRDLQ